MSYVLSMSLEKFSQPAAMDPKMLVHARPMWLINLGRYFELPEQMPCNTSACHDDMSHIRIGSPPTVSPLVEQ